MAVAVEVSVGAAAPTDEPHLADQPVVVLGPLDDGVLDIGLERDGFLYVSDVIANLDLVVGTSAGSTVGAQILSGTDLTDLYAGQTAENHNEISPQLDLEALDDN